MIRVLKNNPRWREYNEYLHKHITNVKRSWDEFIRPYVLENYTGVDISKVDNAIKVHDDSKYDEVEYWPYCNHWYEDPRFPDDELEYKYAWAHHQRCNEHHWQHWILIEDGGKPHCLPIPFEFICEMLADWHSFSYDDPTSTAYHWWTTERENIFVADEAAEIIDDLIQCLQQPLSQIDAL